MQLDRSQFRTWSYHLTRSHDSFQFRDSYAYPQSFFLTLSVSACFFPVLSSLFASTGATNGYLRRASIVFCFETSYQVRFLPRIPSTNRERTSSQPDTEHHRPHRNFEAARTASRRSDLADLPLDLLSTPSPSGNRVSPLPEVSSNLP